MTQLFRPINTSLSPAKSGLVNQLSKLSIGLLLTGSVLTSSGCSWLKPYDPGVTQGNILTIENVELLQVGLTQGQVRELLGPPMGENAFNPKHWEYIYYSTANAKRDSEIDRHVIIEFDQEGLVSGWFTQTMEIDI